MNIVVVDAFDLPDWLGTEAITWRAADPLEASPHVRGSLTASNDRSVDLDLLAVDAAYPAPVCPDRERTAAHQAWHYGEIALLTVDGRLAAAVPGSVVDLSTVCDALRRVARSVGAKESGYTVSIPL